MTEPNCSALPTEIGGFTAPVFGPHVRCVAVSCAADLEGEPIRHGSYRQGAGSSFGPACATHANWPTLSNNSEESP